MASHNHYSPMYTTPSWGVWLFQDVMDIRAFEYQARQMAAAILEAEAGLKPARMGATEVKHYFFKGHGRSPGHRRRRHSGRIPPRLRRLRATGHPFRRHDRPGQSQADGLV